MKDTILKIFSKLRAIKNSNLSTVYLFSYYVFSLVLLETALRVITVDKFFSIDLLITLVFTLSLAACFAVISTFFSAKINHLIASGLMLLSGVMFSSQLGYHSVFRTYYTLYSAGNASQVLDFYGYIWSVITDNFLGVAIFFLPAIIIIFWGKKLLAFDRPSRQNRFVLTGLIIFFYLTGLGTVHSTEGLNSAYDLYFNNSYPKLSVKRLGLFATMRIDLQRQLTGWDPSVKVLEPDLSEAEDEPIEDDIVVEYNVMDIDFEALMANEESKELIQMHQYFKNTQPTAKNEYTGKYEGYNLILIIAESFAPYAAHEEATPNLYKLVNEGYNFSNYYVPSWDVSTTDGEYVSLTSLLPKTGVWSFYKSKRNYLPFVMGNQLKELGYNTVAYHNYTYNYYRRDLSHPNMGYHYTGLGNGLKNVRKVWPPSDLEMMVETVPKFIDSEPFHAYYLTVSGHLQYNFMGNAMAMKNRKYVKDLPCSEQAQAYLATQVELDRALEHLMTGLEEAGVADNTLIALSTDHYPYGLDNETIEEFIGHQVEHNFELYKSAFVLYTPGMEPKTIDKPASSLDIIPTLSNILGLEYDSRLLMGRDIFSDSEPLVIFRNRSFITDQGKFNAETGEFIANAQVEIDENYIDRINTKVHNKFYYSEKILDHDYYNKVLGGSLLQ